MVGDLGKLEHATENQKRCRVSAQVCVCVCEYLQVCVIMMTHYGGSSWGTGTCNRR